ncbi:hypothetical protein, partial [[Mycobacterium] fortunisiensis]|uniref:hypothetical protein n=1 Tax=[Mycobacterium] fortunisiensis TaxID=2600579 RepID=UPI001C25E9AC
GKKSMTKKQQTKTTKHTIEFSNNTPEFAAQKSRGKKPLNLTADSEKTHRNGCLSRISSSLSGACPCRSDLE